MGPPSCTLCSKKSCPRCDQAEESINNLLLSCVFARKFWFKLLQRVGCSSLPRRSGSSLMIGGHWARIDLKPRYHYRKASIPLSFLACGPCGFIVTSVCLVVFLQAWLEPYCSLARRCIFGVWPGLGVSPTSSPLCRCSVICFGLLRVR